MQPPKRLYSLHMVLRPEAKNRSRRPPLSAAAFRGLLYGLAIQLFLAGLAYALYHFHHLGGSR